MPVDRGATYREVRGLTRGLAVLRALNEGRGGELDLLEVAARTGLHRTTVRRILETLLHNGFVRRSASDGSFRLTLVVRQLSEGFTDDEWISTVAAPVLNALMREVVWPTDLGTPDGDAMLIRESTQRHSPLSFNRSMIGTRLPMLTTAMGRAYLANCPRGERLDILRLLRASAEPDSALVRNSRAIVSIIARTRQRGYASNNREWSKESRSAAIALPIRHGERVLGCVNLIWAARAMSVEEAVERYLPALRHAIGQIERAAAELPVPAVS